MRDFTLNTYRLLLTALQEAGYAFQTYADYIGQPLAGKVIVLRHDVDLLPLHSLQTAQLEHNLNICATYYFRSVPESWNESVITQIHALGHEVGYHYENLTTCHGDITKAYTDFVYHLSCLRQLVPVRTVCMHGSPASPFDSKDIWKTHSYTDLGIIAEPYLDTDFSTMFYLTDTGRRWDGYKVSVRDRIDRYQDFWEQQGLVFHSTNDIIRAVRQGKLPNRIMITVHPQRWHARKGAWIRELLLQNIKNVVKRLLNTAIAKQWYYRTSITAQKSKCC